MERAETRVREVAGILNRAHAELIDIVADAITDDTWGGGGISSPEHWLTLRAGLSPSRARLIVAIARRRTELPATMDQFEAGNLSVEQVAAITRHTPAAFDASVAELAVHATVPQIRRAVSRYPFTVPTAEPISTDQQSEHDLEPERGPELNISSDASGRYLLRFTAPADIGALVDTSLRQAKDALFNATGQAASLAEALIATCSADLAAISTPSRREHYRILVHLDQEGAWLNGRPRLPQHLAHALTCDTSMQPVWEREGRPINLGRTRRIVPHRTKALVLDRDRGCRYPGCPTTSGHVDVHHLTHWANGGLTDLDNLLSLCPKHHDRHHAGDYTITGNPDHHPEGLRFTTRQGLPITTNPPPGADPTRKPDRTPYPGPTGETLHTHWITFTPTAS